MSQEVEEGGEHRVHLDVKRVLSPPLQLCLHRTPDADVTGEAGQCDLHFRDSLLEEVLHLLAHLRVLRDGGEDGEEALEEEGVAGVGAQQLEERRGQQPAAQAVQQRDERAQQLLPLQVLAQLGGDGQGDGLEDHDGEVGVQLRDLGVEDGQQVHHVHCGLVERHLRVEEEDQVHEGGLDERGVPRGPLLLRGGEGLEDEEGELVDHHDATGCVVVVLRHVVQHLYQLRQQLPVPSPRVEPGEGEQAAEEGERLQGGEVVVPPLQECLHGGERRGQQGGEAGEGTQEEAAAVLDTGLHDLCVRVCVPLLQQGVERAQVGGGGDRELVTEVCPAE